MFSVIIRVKNEERWIGHTIQSVLDFIPKNEIIIINNNSNDDSIKICNLFNKNKKLNSETSKYTDIKILDINQYTPGKALNLGIKHANYDNIMIISAHCVIKKFDPSKITQLLKSTPAIFGKQIPIYNGKKITPRYIWSHFGEEEKFNLFSTMENRFFFHNAFSFFSKNILCQHPFDEELEGKEDRYWVNELVPKKFQYLYCPDFICDHHFTVNGNTWKGIG